MPTDETPDGVALRLPVLHREEWLDLRRRDVTASEIAAVVNVHPYLTPYEVFAVKSGLYAADAVETAAMVRGRYLESVAVRLIRERMPDAAIEHNVHPNGDPATYYRHRTRRIGATPDVLVDDAVRGPGVVQIKSIEPSVFRRTWGTDDRTIEPPLWVGLQALTEAKLTGATWAAVAALRVGFGIDFDLVDVPLHDGAWDRLVEAVEGFWKLVEAGTPPPPDYNRDGRLIAALYPESAAGTVVDLSHDNELVDAVARRIMAKQKIVELEDVVERCGATIRHKAGTAERVLAGDFSITLKSQHTRAYTVAERTSRPIRIKPRGEKNAVA